VASSQAAPKKAQKAEPKKAVKKEPVQKNQTTDQHMSSTEVEVTEFYLTRDQEQERLV
jgi:hypothetical protein